MRALLFIIPALLFLANCSPSPLIRPLAKSEQAISATFGGPLIGYSNLTIPIPFVMAGYEYGLKENLSLSCESNLTSLSFGDLNLKTGALYELFAPSGKIPGVSIAPAFHFMLDTWEWHFRFYPQLDANSYWAYGKNQNLVYTGLENWFELLSKNEYGKKVTQHWIPILKIGHTFMRPKSQYTLEVKDIAFTNSNKDLVVGYKTPFDHGALGLYFGYARKF